MNVKTNLRFDDSDIIVLFIKFRSNECDRNSPLFCSDFCDINEFIFTELICTT